MNYSGFSGYGISSVYPNMGNGVNQNLETAPEPDEQQTYTQVAEVAQPGVDSKSKTNMLLFIGGIIAIIVLFSKQ